MGESEDCCRGVVGGADRAVLVDVRGPPGPVVVGGCARFCSVAESALLKCLSGGSLLGGIPSPVQRRGGSTAGGRAGRWPWWRRCPRSGPGWSLRVQVTWMSSPVVLCLPEYRSGLCPFTAGALAWRARAMTGVRAGTWDTPALDARGIWGRFEVQEHQDRSHTPVGTRPRSARAGHRDPDPAASNRLAHVEDVLAG